jgi:hypothetical protein
MIGGLKRAKIFKFDEFETSFKQSTTVFIIPNYLDLETFEDILSLSWDVTEFEVIKQQDFDASNYFDANYSFASIKYEITKSDYGTSGIFYYDIYDIEQDKIIKEIRKYSQKQLKRKLPKILQKYSASIASCILQSNGLLRYYSMDQEKINKQINNDNVFENFSPGIFQNIIQDINRHLKEKKYSPYGIVNDNELKKLAKSTLYIDRFSLPRNLKKGTDSGSENLENNPIFEEYKFDFKLTNINNISSNILEEEDFYYLRFTSVDNATYFEIVNSITGETIYKAQGSIIRRGKGRRTFKKLLKNLNYIMHKIIK